MMSPTFIFYVGVAFGCFAGASLMALLIIYLGSKYPTNGGKK